MQDRIILMGVAFSTFNGEAKKGSSENVGTIGGVFCQILLFQDAAFLGDGVIAVKSSGETLFVSWIREKVSG